MMEVIANNTTIVKTTPMPICTALRLGFLSAKAVIIVLAAVATVVYGFSWWDDVKK